MVEMPGHAVWNIRAQHIDDTVADGHAGLGEISA
jgi:hypothetical protein